VYLRERSNGELLTLFMSNNFLYCLARAFFGSVRTCKINISVVIWPDIHAKEIYSKLKNRLGVLT